MTRKTLASRIVEAPEKAPVTAWIFFAVLLGLWGWRMYQHNGVPEDAKHIAVDAGLLVASMCAAPGFMRYFAGNATRAIGLYKAYRAAKREPTSEGDR